MIWIAYAIMYVAELAVGCWLVHEGYQAAGATVLIISFIGGGWTLHRCAKKQYGLE